MDEELKKAIRVAVREGIEDTLTKYGVDTNDPNAMQADMIYLRKSRTGSDEVIKWNQTLSHYRRAHRGAGGAVARHKNHHAGRLI